MNDVNRLIIMLFHSMPFYGSGPEGGRKLENTLFMWLIFITFPPRKQHMQMGKLNYFTQKQPTNIISLVICIPF